jgi:hypothetical protein
MKITTTQTTTQTREMSVSFPTFTKVKDSAVTYYYAVISEKSAVRVADYVYITGSICNTSDVTKAFENGFEFIDEVEFKVALFNFQSTINSECSSVEAKLKEFKTDAKAEQERDEYFEIADTERAELEDYRMQNGSIED